MIVQVALTVICIPPAIGISEEALRDRRIRGQFPAEQYLAVASRSIATSPPVATSRRRSPGRSDIRGARTARSRRSRTFAASRSATVFPGWAPRSGPPRWKCAGGRAGGDPQSLDGGVGPGYFEAFEIPMWRAATSTMAIARPAHDRPRQRGVRAPLHERREPGRPARALRQRRTRRSRAVARDRRHGSRHRHDADRSRRGAVRIHAASAATASPLVMGVRVAGDPAALAPRLRAIAAELDPACGWTKCGRSTSSPGARTCR